MAIAELACGVSNGSDTVTAVNALINEEAPRYERLYDGFSLATSQQPTARGVANKIQLEFGAGGGGAGQPFTVDSLGTLTINETASYGLKVGMQFGRTGSAGTSGLLFWIEVNGVQAGKTLAERVTNTDDIAYIEIDTERYIPAGTEIKVFMMRDLAGNNSGGVFQVLPTDEGVDTPNPAPSASLRVDRLIKAP